MMMGSLEDDITQVNTIPQGIPDVVNDLDIEDAEVAIENMEVRKLLNFQRKLLHFSRIIL